MQKHDDEKVKEILNILDRSATRMMIKQILMLVMLFLVGVVLWAIGTIYPEALPIEGSKVVLIGQFCAMTACTAALTVWFITRK